MPPLFSPPPLDSPVPRVWVAGVGPRMVATLTMVATGRAEEELSSAVGAVRRQIGFYASTPAYEPVLAHHGWSDVRREAHRLATSGRWDELGDLVDDAVLGTFAVVGDVPAAAAGLRGRFDGLASRTCPSIPYDADDLLAPDLLSAAREGQDGLA